MTFILPPQSSKRHQQLNKGDLSGTIFASKNINLDEEGYIKLADATFAQYTTDDDTNFDTVDAMFPMDGSIYLNSNEVFSGELDGGPLSQHAEDTGVPTPGVEEDVIYFNGVEVISDGTSIYYQGTSGVWTAVSMSGFTTSVPTAMCTWGAENSLAIGNSNKIKFVNTSWAVNGTVMTLPNEYQVSSLASNGSQLYIATRSKSGGEAMIFVANGIAASADSMYSCGTFELASIKTFKSSIVGITSLGQLVQFTGGGFSELASLPVYASSKEWADALNDYSRVSNRAMTVDGDLVYVNLDSTLYGGRTLPYFPSGVWCYDDTNKSLYHKHSLTYSRVLALSGAVVTPNAITNEFTSGSSIATCMTGMPVIYVSGTAKIPELNERTAYYLIKISSSVFKLATSYTNALAGTAIDISGVGDAGQDFYIFRTNDYGWTTPYNNRGAIAILNSTTFRDYIAGRICMTGELFSKQNSTTTRTVFCGVSPYIPNRGYFITPKLESQNIEDTFQKLYIKHKPLKTDEKIIVKYKSKDIDGFPFDSRENPDGTLNWRGIWTDTDTFTTVVDLSEIVAGDEIEIISGVGAGHIAHVSSISVNAGTYTVNLSEAFPFAVANDVFYFSVDKWTLLETIDSTNPTNEDGYLEIGISDKDGLPVNSRFIQFKVEMRGVGVTISELQVSNQGNKYASVYN